MNKDRPPHVQPPAYLSENLPLPSPELVAPQPESGGPKGPEPTRYNDWENKGICRDF